MAKGPYLPNITELMSMGINPKTGLPIKFGSNPKTLKDDIRKAIRVVDEQDAIGRYQWFNLPDTIDGELIERMLYYRGQGMFFYMKTNNTFYFLPYALDGSIDVVGRYTGVTPLPFNGTANDGDKSKPWIQGLNRTPVYAPIYRELEEKDILESCVLLHDYCPQIAQTIIPRQVLNDPIVTVEAEMIPLMRTSCILGTGVKGMRVNDADQAESVDIASKSVEDSAMTGRGWIPIVGNIEFQELTDASNLKGADYMQAMQSIDNFRLSLFGLDNGGLFEKKAHELESEQALNGGSVSHVFQDGLTRRQKFCNIVNSIWNLGIWCEPSEASMGGDSDGDGMGYDVEDPSTSNGDFDNGGMDNATDV